MSTKLTAETLIAMTVQERKALITQQSSFIDASHITDQNLHNAYRFAQVISSIATMYFQSQIEQDNQHNSVLERERQSELIRAKTERFADKFIEWLKKDFDNKKAILDNHPNPSNLFELCGAKLLITSNSVTRSLSTKMGRLWEEISNISPYVIVPEFEFDIKITGVDITVMIDDTVSFAQLKTSKGTLTGSQVPRAKQELGIHDNPLFIAAFDLGSWSLSSKSQISRIAGKAFWNQIHMDYELVEYHVRNMLKNIDQVFAELAAN
jgi:hypothetical protein